MRTAVMRTVAVLLAVSICMRSRPLAQALSPLPPGDVEDAIRLAVEREPNGYPLQRHLPPIGHEMAAAYAYTPFVRVAMAAYTIIREKGFVPGPADVAANGQDGLVYVGLLDFAMVDSKPWIREPRTRRVVRFDLTPDFNYNTYPAEPFKGTPAVWGAWKDAPAIVALGFEFPKRTYLIGAFSRDTLAKGGYVVAQVSATDGHGEWAEMVNYAAVAPGEALKWR